MPTYEYACRACGARVEVVQRITAEPLRICDSCGGELRRVLFAPGVIYKGSGFYTTDYARKNGKGETKSDSDGAEKKTEEKKSDEKKESNAAKSSESSSRDKT